MGKAFTDIAVKVPGEGRGATDTVGGRGACGAVGHGGVTVHTSKSVEVGAIRALSQAESRKG